MASSSSNNPFLQVAGKPTGTEEDNQVTNGTFRQPSPQPSNTTTDKAMIFNDGGNHSK